MAPLIRTSLAPAGHTPVLRHRAKHRQKVSVAAALIRAPGPQGHARLVYEIFPDRYVDNFLYAQFLRDRLLARVRGPVVLLQDGAALHGGEWTDELLEDVPRLEIHDLPPYAPDYNPVEGLWNWDKDKQLVNFQPQDLDQLVITTQYVMDQAAHDQRRLQSFFEASYLTW
jgi:putative transposase